MKLKPNIKSQLDLSSSNEYEMLRAEILQHIQMYQTLQNMMYTITVAILVLNVSLGNVYYFNLIPLTVIIPSFILASEYRGYVTKDSIYLRVFYEEMNTTPDYRWEERLNKLRVLEKGSQIKWWQKRRLWVRESADNFAYVFSAAVCIALYYAYAVKRLIENFNQYRHPVVRGVADAVILLVCVAGCTIVFVLFWKYDKDEIYRQWIEIRDKEASEE